MATISIRRLSDATVKKYEELERSGQLSSRQSRWLANHRWICSGEPAELMHTAYETTRSDYAELGAPVAETPGDGLGED